MTLSQQWNERHRARGRLSEPSGFVVEAAKWFPPGGRVLDVAGGAGRNAVWLAGRGFVVTLADFSPVAVTMAGESAEEAGVALDALVWNGETDGLPGDEWDAIVIHHYLDRSVLDRSLEALVSGGVLAFCQPTLRNLERNERPGERWLLGEGELEEWAAVRSGSLEVLVLEERWFDNGRHEGRLLARRIARLT